VYAGFCAHRERWGLGPTQMHPDRLQQRLFTATVSVARLQEQTAHDAAAASHTLGLTACLPDC
jgi:hypothetical protein